VAQQRNIYPALESCGLPKHTPRATFRLTWSKGHVVTTSGHHRNEGSKKRKICFDHLLDCLLHGNAKRLNHGSKIDGARKVAQQKSTYPASENP
jgi:hypothetical protein